MELCQWNYANGTKPIVKLIVSVFLLVCILLPPKPVFAVESHAVILMYHRFGEDKYPATNIKIEQFIQQLDFISEKGFNVWPLAEIVHHLQNKIPMPDKVIAITIDDAYLSVYQIAYPLLLERNLPFTLFVSAGVVDKAYSAYMNWPQIQDMVGHGVSLGNHSLNHFYLVEQKDQVDSEIMSNQKRIAEMTGLQTLLFAYPYGEYDLEIANKVEALNYVGFGQQSGPVGENMDFRFLPRFPVSEQYANMQGFQDKLYSLPMPIAAVKPEEIRISLAVPSMMVSLKKPVLAKDSLRCFASGQGQANVRWMSQSRFIVQSKKPLVLRRSRYNCTMRDPVSGRFLWYSHVWLRPEIGEP